MIARIEALNYRCLRYIRQDLGPFESTDIVLGRKHPALRDWKGETNLGVLFAAGVLA
jgi:hypothetical protein